jgi:hypothetical protein
MDKKELLLRRNATNTREVSLGEIVLVVRGLTRDEVTECTGKNINSAKDVEKLDKGIVENKLISTALVDPVMTEEEVALWLKGAPAGDSVAVMEAISELSGLSEGAAKSGVSTVRKRSRR